METLRFAFLSDTHIVEPVNPVIRRVLNWTRDYEQANGIRDLVLGGDLTHHASPAQALAALECLDFPGARLHFIPGNNEGLALAWDERRFPLPITGVRRLDWPGAAFALGVVDGAGLQAALLELAAQLPAAGPVLVFAHLPPDEAGPVPEAFCQPGREIVWICGHQHEGITRRAGGVRVEMAGGLDPVKVRGHLPELLTGEWDGRTIRLHRVRAPLEVLRSPPSFPPNPIGLACRGRAADLLDMAVEQAIPALQFRHDDVTGSASALDLAAAARFRAACPAGFLSLHLSDLSVEVDAVSLKRELAWAEAMGVDDLTLHLPKEPEARLFDAEGRILDSPWACACLDRYVRLAEQALRMGAGLSLENLYNKNRVPRGEDQLSSRPWHLVRVVDRLRALLSERGHADADVERIGILFDAGHAFRDPWSSKTHGLGDWIHQTAPYMRGAHLHQVREHEGKLVNHEPITGLFGPRINFAGLLPLFAEIVPQPVPLLIEVRDPAAALASRRVLADYANAGAT